MTRPLRYINRPGIGIDFQEMSATQLARLRYNLRVLYANQINADGAGAIVIGGGTNFGSASNTERTVRTAVSVSSFPNIGTGTTSRNSYSYGINRNGIPSAPTDFTNSYMGFSGTDFRQERDLNEIESAIINPCITEMKTGDEVGTYRVASSSPGSGWVDKGLWFRDSIYNNSAIGTYNLYLRTSATPPANSTVLPLRVTPGGDFREHSQASGSLFESFLYQVLVNRILNENALTYDIGGDAGTARGSFIDTRRDDTNRVTFQANADSYRTTVTPSGTAATFTTYTLRII